MKGILKKIVGPEILGYYDYLAKPELKKSWGGAFNGQEFRQKIFFQILENIDVDLIVETGTFRGVTTEFMSEHSTSKIITIEANKRFYSFSKLRFLSNKNIVLKYGDSRDLLKEVLSDPKFGSQCIFFYLDSHWEEDLPLVEELKIIFKNCMNPVIMIDDFKVPEDNGYKYDDYGPGKRLSLEIFDEISDVIIYKFFPREKSENETGAKRGSVIITHSEKIKNLLLKLDTLKMLQ